MPNDVLTVLNADKGVLDFFLPENVDEDWRGVPIVVDFGKVIPRPDIGDPIYTATYDERLQGWHTDGYSRLDWSREYWGVRANAYNTERLSDTCLCFYTAWDHPFPVIKELSRKFPEHLIRVQYLDVDGESCAGTYSIRNGVEIADEHYAPITEMMIEAYALVMGPKHREAANRWLAAHDAKVWDEGYVAGANADLEDWENAPSLIENPYRTEEK